AWPTTTSARRSRTSAVRSTSSSPSWLRSSWSPRSSTSTGRKTSTRPAPKRRSRASSNPPERRRVRPIARPRARRNLHPRDWKNGSFKTDKEGSMSGVRLLVGTRKGAFVLTSDGTRDDWNVEGPLFTGWEIYHLNGSPADPDRLYASQSTGWHGQVMQRSDDGGKSWEAVGNEFAYDGVPGTHQWYDGTQHPWEFARVWHLEPSLSDPDTVYAGVEDAALFRSTDGG